MSDIDMKTSSLRVLACAALFWLCGSAAIAANVVVYNEARLGDIPAPAPGPVDWDTVYVFELSPDSNVISGSMPMSATSESQQVDQDPFRIVIPPGYECRKIRLSYAWDADDHWRYFIYGVTLIDDATGAVYRDDEIVFSSDPDFGADADLSPVRLFRKIEVIDGQIPPLDDFPQTGLTLSSGTWNVFPSDSALGWQGPVSRATLRYKLLFVLSPVQAPQTIESRFEDLSDEVRSLPGIRRVRRELVTVVDAAFAAHQTGHSAAARAALKDFNSAVERNHEDHGGVIAALPAKQLMSAARKIIREL